MLSVIQWLHLPVLVFRHLPHCYSGSLKRPKRMTGKFVSFCQDSNNVNNNHYKSREKDNTLLKGFSNRHIKNICFISAIFWEISLLLIFVNNNLFSDRDLASSSNRTYNFFNSALLLHRSPEVIACNNRSIFLTNIFNNIYIYPNCLADQFYKIISNVNMFLSLLLFCLC